MAALVFSPDQRFTCAQCGRCCRRTTVPVTADEADRYRKAGAAQWFDEGAGSPESAGAKADPFEPIPGHAPLLRIRKRPDGSCGFLTSAGLCRIHEMLGADRKPLACRMFPFNFRTVEDSAIVTASFACPTVVAGGGATLAAQKGALQTLHEAWRHEFQERAAPVEFVRGHALTRIALTRMRTLLANVLDRPDPQRPDRRPDLRANLRRIAILLEDWSRTRVLALAPDRFLEYIELTGKYAAASNTPPPTRAATRVGRLLFRGFMLAVLALQARLDPIRGRHKLPLAVTNVRLLAHLHGFGPAVADFNLRRATRVPLDLEDAPVHAIIHRHLRAAFTTLGATARPVVDEVAMRIAQMNAACLVGAMHAATARKHAVDAESLAEGLLVAGDLSHADAGGTLSAGLTLFTGGLESLYLFPPIAIHPSRS